jgi:F-type H+-transporting ATPase subunit epsilon
MAESERVSVLVITPERQVLEETADSVVIPAHDGELGVLRDRAALMCELGIGQLRYSQAGQTRRLFIDGGFAQVLDNRITVLTSRAILAEQIDANVMTQAEQAVTGEHGHDPEARVAHERAQRRLSVLRHLRPSR